MISDFIEQRTLAWQRVRFGSITGSKVSDIMRSGRKKDEMWSETAKSYLYQIAAERLFNPDFLNDDDIFQDYINQTNVTTRAMQWGVEQEQSARELYAKISGVDVEEAGSCAHDTIPHFAASPDGIIYRDNDNKVLEIKCPALATHMRYVAEITDGATLKAVKPEYYWQVMAEMACTGSKSADFVSYCAWLVHPIHIVHVERNDEDIALMEERVKLANDFIDEIINK
jgi:putative phage-type endonuclease